MAYRNSKRRYYRRKRAMIRSIAKKIPVFKGLGNP